MMWGYGSGWGWLMMSFGTVLWIALLAVLVWALIRWLSNKTSTSTPMMTHMPPSGPSAEEILRQRYARGEIDTATFEQMRERLQASDSRRSQYENPPTTGVRETSRGCSLLCERHRYGFHHGRLSCCHGSIA